MKADVISRATGSGDSQRTAFSAKSSSAKSSLAKPSLVVDRGFDFKLFAEHMSRRIPVYALTVFIKLCRALDVIETFKRQKQRLIREGFDLSMGDPLSLRNPTTGDYRPIDRAVYARIAEASIRF
jgi:fatty-acyl-CoA synthase